MKCKKCGNELLTLDQPCPFCGQIPNNMSIEIVDDIQIDQDTNNQANGVVEQLNVADNLNNQVNNNDIVEQLDMNENNNVSVTTPVKKGKTKLLLILVVIAIVGVILYFVIPTYLTKIIIGDTSSKVFINDADNIVKGINNAYMDKLSSNTNTSLTLNDSNIHEIIIDNVNYKYLCMTIKDLVDQQYIVKDPSSIYGYIQLFVSSIKSDNIIYINISDGKHYLQGQTKDLFGENTKVSTNTVSGIEKPSANISCPDTVNEIPTANNIK